MKRIIFFLLVVFVVQVSCSEKPAATSASDVPVTHKEISSEVVKTVANLSIEGMTCSEGCGGKIQKDLQALAGVLSTNLDFADGRTENVVTVEFDPTKVDEQKMIACVNSSMDGMYKVKSVEVVKYSGLQGNTSASPDADASAMTSTGFSNCSIYCSLFPNL
ncbi:MAG: heavy metal-associated domain-containing protein [Flavobacteriales bacterium]|nr:heavy metal-associated domain-containing protein [Flavobacteriales bacterium]